ncbi:MAG: PEP-CTERM sorting domain-containing protein [Betaproteobacteria bacterium]|nr:PEP-CTERM sorting domain-containing protein [Betaproteobacteria bacterium]
MLTTGEFTTAVPEPATVGLMLAGLGFLGAVRRRRTAA